MKRGALIVIEGVDRTGKSTQCKELVNNLLNKGVQAQYTNFPSRQTEIGKTINNYLTFKNNLSDEAIHLLFSANRWERAQEILKTLEQGINIIVDRYCYSGVAYSAAKGLDLKWCKSPDIGLPKPDKVFFLTMPLNIVQTRKEYGNERYEELEFHKKVSEVYMKLKDESWDILDASRSIEVIQEDLLKRTLDVVNELEDKPVGKVWMDSL
ncbi:thymidylate kinase [Amyelois transitella]|uniref:thymidylate kinase n=1 Tax=Amyelois transitella TaxID=680683 RepID=UPI00067E5BDC|nr:thymidylate kinase [Amyelois transitella]